MAVRNRETDIVRSCLDLLSLLGIRAWRNNTGATRFANSKGKQQLVRYGTPGSGDIFAILPGGRFLSIECKRPGGRPTPAQLAWAEWVTVAGGVSLVVTSAKELEEKLRVLL